MVRSNLYLKYEIASLTLAMTENLPLGCHPDQSVGEGHFLLYQHSVITEAVKQLKDNIDTLFSRPCVFDQLNI